MAEITFIDNGVEHTKTIKDVSAYIGYSTTTGHSRYHSAIENGCITDQEIFDYMKNRPVSKQDQPEPEKMTNPLFEAFCLMKPLERV